LGDPTEGALLYLSQKTGLLIDMVRKEWKIVDEQPFDSVSKIMSVTVENSSKCKVQSSKLTFTKGAPESILAGCNTIQIGRQTEKLTERKKAQIEEQVEKWARKGLRVLAFSYSTIDDRKLKMVFLGLVAIHDAPRPEVTEAVRKAKGAGIKIVMITGDNEKTAEAVGVVAGIIEEGDEIITGSQLEEYSDQDLLKILPKTKIFARTNPFQKHRIVKLFQQLGEVVAVTGDGVNDAIALKQSDVGVAMGFVGTDVARETADMILTDDNFATLVNAIEEGRNIIKNIKNTIKYLLTCNLTEGLSLINALLIGINHLFYPIQLLYINLITDGLPALSLAFSPKDPNLMSQKPEKEMKLLKSFDQKYILFVGLWGTVLVLTSYFFWGKTAAFTVLTLIQPFILIDLWLSHQRVRKNFNLLNKPIFLISFLFPFVLQFILVRFNFTIYLFKIAPVSLLIFIQLVVVSASTLLGIKLVKKINK
jgi:Ca2+-transporting ATPase